MSTPETILCPDNGPIPNSRLPVLLYRQVIPADEPDFARWLERTFVANNWTNNWRNGIYPYHHYHSTTHEALGIYRGSATLQLGGEQGPEIAVSSGDILIIPAGVGHCNQQHSADFGVFGGYPDGRDWDLLRGLPGERLKADQTIATVPLPATDPLYGSSGPLIQHWH